MVLWVFFRFAVLCLIWLFHCLRVLLVLSVFAYVVVSVFVVFGWVFLCAHLVKGIILLSVFGYVFGFSLSCFELSMFGFVFSRSGSICCVCMSLCGVCLAIAIVLALALAFC